ncbi:YncE family protein [Salinimicrobium xinjiangense]|uniref:YncE family protein n=1 Tax=Salinimicrobium xinjiangense TaxID=438596 RepID=UPI00048CA37B|nr:DUF5074 domain-containing protein [Salinimicrobium xinjiangense]
MQIKNLFYFLLASSILVSCSTDDDNPDIPEPSGAYTDGVVILNEGNFGQGNSSVSFLDPQSGNVNHNIFKTVNGEGLGDTATDIGFYEDLAFIVVNVSNTIQVVDRHTFEHVATIDTDLNNPRKIAFLNGMAYITNWGEGSNPDDDYIAVFNAKDFQLSIKIAVEEGPEDILEQGSKIFVAHLGGWSYNNVVSVISNNEVVKTIEVGEGPNSLAAGNDFLWVSASGLPDWMGETAGSISKINLSTLEVVQDYTFEDVSQHPNHLNLNNGNVFYTLENEVYSFATSETSLPATPLYTLEEVDYLYGFTILEGKAYAASADPGFTGNGKLYVYEAATGSLSSGYDTGINPNGAYFNSL